jgi:hypothetical protein
VLQRGHEQAAAFSTRSGASCDFKIALKEVLVDARFATRSRSRTKYRPNGKLLRTNDPGLGARASKVLDRFRASRTRGFGFQFTRTPPIILSNRGTYTHPRIATDSRSCDQIPCLGQLPAPKHPSKWARLGLLRSAEDSPKCTRNSTQNQPKNAELNLADTGSWLFSADLARLKISQGTILGYIL